MAAENTYPHHTRDRFAWLDQVLADRAIPEPAFRVAYALSSFVNRKSGAAWPSHATLAQKTGLGESTVRRHLVSLHTAGHLAVELHRGRNGTNRYRPIIRPASDADEPTENRSEMSGTAPLNPDERTAHFWTSDRSEVSDNPSEEPTAPPRGADWERDDADRAAPPDGGARSEEDDGWRDFWQLWQRGHGDDESKVRKAYIDAIRQHGAEAILASARRWRAAREPHYLPKPVPWLQGGWRDEPPLKRQAAGNDRRQGATIDPTEAMLRAGGVL